MSTNVKLSIYKASRVTDRATDRERQHGPVNSASMFLRRDARCDARPWCRVRQTSARRVVIKFDRNWRNMIN